MKAGVNKKVHFFNLDILRFLAIAMVVVFHGHIAYSGYIHYPTFLTTGDSTYTLSAFGIYGQNFFINMSLGVDLFFLVSGFLITYLLLIEKGEYEKINIGKFYTRRILRIWPLYFLIVAFTPLIIRYTGDHSPNYLGTCFFMNNFETIQRGHVDYPFVHFWTISVEEHYYLLWPLLLTIIPIRYLPVLFTALISSALLYRTISVLTNPNWYMDINYNTLTRGDVIVMGSLLAWIHFRKPIVIMISKPIRIIVYLLFLFGLIYWNSTELNTVYAAIFKKYFFVGGFLFLFLNYIFDPNALFNFRKKNFLHYLGKISFGIYLIHNILLPYVIKQVMWRFHTESPYIFWLVYVSVVVLLAVASYELIEKRILRLKDRFAVVSTER